MTSTQLTVIILAIVTNIIAFILVGYDKDKSRNDERRVPEVYFFFYSIFFSSFGVLAGMFTFHHKTKKLIFVIGITAMALQQAALIYLLLTYR